MTKPNEKEQVDEELSTDELKSVSGGYTDGGGQAENRRPNLGKHQFPIDPTSSGSGMTLKDWKKSRQGVMDPNDCPD